MDKRVMLKVSGEQLASDEYNFDISQAKKVSSVIKALTQNGYSVAVVMGGGNIVRGNKLYKNGFTNQVIADQMGMLATVQNGLFLAEILKQEGHDNTYLFSNIPVESVAERFSYKRADSQLAHGNIVLIAGGLGKPGFTTDTGVVAQAFELHCIIVVKTTKVDGIYDKNPAEYSDAIRLPKLTYNEAVNNPDIAVMDNAAMALAGDKKIILAVCQLDPDAVLAVLGGDTTKFGTIVS